MRGAYVEVLDTDLVCLQKVHWESSYLAVVPWPMINLHKMLLSSDLINIYNHSNSVMIEESLHTFLRQILAAKWTSRIPGTIIASSFYTIKAKLLLECVWLWHDTCGNDESLRTTKRLFIICNSAILQNYFEVHQNIILLNCHYMAIESIILNINSIDCSLCVCLLSICYSAYILLLIINTISYYYATF